MDDIVWFARYTSSGLPGTMNLDADLFDIAFESAIRLYELENKTPE